MVKRIGTTQRKSRHKFQLKYREKGKIPLSRYFQVFSAGEKVGLKIHPNVHEGRFFSRFHGMCGSITGVKKGSCYEVKITDGGKAKTLYVHPIHMKTMQVINK